jgi:hypothetical protein
MGMQLVRKWNAWVWLFTHVRKSRLFVFNLAILFTSAVGGAISDSVSGQLHKHISL